jgi:hypothetical protein
MADVLFISEGRLKKLTAVQENVEPQDLMPHVLEAQDIHIQGLLGTKYYNSLKAKIVAATLTVADEALLDNYIAPTLANYAVYQALPSLTFKIFNKSLMQPTSETAISASIDQMKYIRQSVLDTAEFYRERAREFLRDNLTDYPDYANPGVDGMFPDKQPDYFHGIVLPKMGGCGYYNDPNEIDGPDAGAGA